MALQVVFTKLAESSWRTLLFWIGPPGLVIAGLSLLTLAEPRTSSANFVTSLMRALKPRPKSQVAAEDIVPATQYSRVGLSDVSYACILSGLIMPAVTPLVPGSSKNTCIPHHLCAVAPALCSPSLWRHQN